MGGGASISPRFFEVLNRDSPHGIFEKRFEPKWPAPLSAKAVATQCAATLARSRDKSPFTPEGHA